MLHRMHSRRLAALAATVVVVGAGLVAPVAKAESTSCTATECTVSFVHTGDLQTFTVPAGVTEITVTVTGAQGGGYKLTDWSTIAGGPRRSDDSHAHRHTSQYLHGRGGRSG